jgi:hypothetical protein
MIKLKINIAHDKSKLEGFIFFAERVRELLGNHTMDSFKASALNTKTRGRELERLFLHASDTTQRANSLSPLLDEFSDSVKNDPIIQKLKSRDVLDRLTQEIAAGLDNEKPKLFAEAADALKAVNSLLSNYFENAKAILLEEIPKNKEKKTISSVADIFVVQVQAKGYSREFIRHASKTKLAGPLVGSQALDVQSVLKDFFSLFETENKEYICATRCRGTIDEISANALNITVVDEIKGFQKIEMLSLHSSAGSNVEYNKYLVATDVKGKDHFSARNKLYDLLYRQNALNLFVLHDSPFEFDRMCLVKDIATKKQVRVWEPTNVMLLGHTRHEAEIPFEEKQKALMKTFARFDAKGRAALLSVIRYHKEAIDSFSSENKLVDLWAALEGFVPQPIDHSPRVSSVIDHILPALTLIYAERKFSYVASGLIVGGHNVVTLINNVKVDGDFNRKVAALILCPELKDDLDSLLKLLDYSPLLRCRLYLLYEAFATPKKAHEELLRHRRRLDHQLRRIYISRNTVMHSATVHSDIDLLVENLHSYLDATVNAVIDIGSKSTSGTNINSILKLLSAHEKSYLHSLGHNENKDASFKVTTFGDVFGEGKNPLLKWSRH